MTLSHVSPVDSNLQLLRLLPEEPSHSWIFPGQGAQAVGMAQDLAHTFGIAEQVFVEANAALGFDLAEICFNGPNETLSQTKFTQPALVAHSIAALLAAHDAGKITTRPAFTAGHSLGEYASLIVSGSISFADGIRLVQTRGQLMQEACDTEVGTMAAVLGLDISAIQELCDANSSDICNINAPGNVTIGGSEEAVNASMEAAAEAGAAKVVPLSVAGAFHTPLMQTAADRMAGIIETTVFADPLIPVISNVTTDSIVLGESIAAELLAQITAPVLWLDGINYMHSAGVRSLFEFGPGRVLTGAAKRTHSDFELNDIGTVEDIEKL